MAYRDPAQGRAADRARFRRRTEQRRAAGLCPRCGERRPEDGLSLCGPCAEKRRVSERARDRMRRKAGIKRRRNPAGERARGRRRRADRIARGVCTRCGREPAAPARRLCAGCGEKRRAVDRAKYAAAKSDGLAYGGKNPGAKRKAGRAASAKRRQARLDAGQCARCGCRPPVEGGTTCEPCRDARRRADRELYAARRAAGACVKCAAPVFGGESRCGVCAAVDGERRDNFGKNAAARKRYAARRARSACTDCGAPAFGACRCPLLREALVRAVRPLPGDAGLSARHRGVSARDRGVPRRVRRRDGGGRLARLREALRRSGRDGARRQSARGPGGVGMNRRGAGARAGEKRFSGERPGGSGERVSRSDPRASPQGDRDVRLRSGRRYRPRHPHRRRAAGRGGARSQGHPGGPRTPRRRRRVRGKRDESERKGAGERFRSPPLANPSSIIETSRSNDMSFGLNRAELIGRIGADVTDEPSGLGRARGQFQRRDRRILYRPQFGQPRCSASSGTGL